MASSWIAFSAVAYADDAIDGLAMLARLRDPAMPRQVRLELVISLGRRAGEDEQAAFALRAAVITDDRHLRTAIARALVAARQLSPAGARRIPALAEVARHMRAISRWPIYGPFAYVHCFVDGERGRGLRVSCSAQAWENGCVSISTEVTFEIGRRWRVMRVDSRRGHDDMCGSCQ